MTRHFGGAGAVSETVREEWDWTPRGVATRTWYQKWCVFVFRRCGTRCERNPLDHLKNKLTQWHEPDNFSLARNGNSAAT